MGVIVFGTGKIANKIKKCIDEDILGFIDNDQSKWGTLFLGRKVYSPAEGLSLDFDSVIIASTKYYKELYNQLRTEYDIPDCKIISFIQNDVVCTPFGLRKMRDWIYFRLLANIMATDEDKRILDIGCSCITAGIYHRGDYLLDTLGVNVSLYGYNAHNFEIGKVYENLYEDVWEKDGVAPHHYQIAFISDADLQFSYSECCQIIKDVLPYCDEIILSVGNRNTYELEKDLSAVSVVDRFVLYNGLTIIRILPINAKKQIEGLKVYVVSHKDFDQPHGINKDVYVPMFVGKHVGKEGDLSDSLFEDNIADLNPWINECTAMYWIWKHSDAQYVGINHYRRFFLHSSCCYPYAGNVVSPGEIMRIFQEGYDIITARPGTRWQENGVLNMIEETVDPKAFELGYRAIEKAMEKYHPEDLLLWQQSLQGINMFPCNMFITSKEQFNQYCEWLFPVLLESLKNVDLSEFDSYSSRVIGFFAERMLTVWIIKQGLKVKQLQLWVTEDV